MADNFTMLFRHQRKTILAMLANSMDQIDFSLTIKCASGKLVYRSVIIGGFGSDFGIVTQRMPGCVAPALQGAADIVQ